MKESFLAEAASLALEIVIPDRVALAEAGLTFDETRPAEPGRLEAVAERMAEGSRALAGSLVWSDWDRGWLADWRLSHQGRTVPSQVRGSASKGSASTALSFDAAFRNALRGAAQTLSGNGQPQ